MHPTPRQIENALCIEKEMTIICEVLNAQHSKEALFKAFLVFEVTPRQLKAFQETYNTSSQFINLSGIEIQLVEKSNLLRTIYTDHEIFGLLTVAFTTHDVEYTWGADNSERNETQTRLESIQSVKTKEGREILGLMNEIEDPELQVIKDWLDQLVSEGKEVLV